MKDFDIAKFLRENQLGSYGILNHYVDLKPLKEEGEKTGEVKVGDTLKHKSTDTVLKVTAVSGNDITTKVTKSTDKRFKVGDTIKTNKNLIGKTYSLNEDVTPEEIAEIPYEGPEPKLDGFGDEFEQAETVSEEEFEEEWHPEQTVDAEEMITNAISRLKDAGISIDQVKAFIEKQSVRNPDSAVFETISEAPKKIDWQDLEDTDLAGSGMEIEIDDFIDRTEKTIQFELTNDSTISQLNRENPRQAAAQIRLLIKKLWLEKIRNWKG